jgi:hypothetical protein
MPLFEGERFILKGDRFFYYRFPDSREFCNKEYFPWLRLKTPVLQQNTDNLCSFCNQLDFEFLFQRKPKVNGLSVSISLGPLSRLRISNCGFCHYLAGLIRYGNPESEFKANDVEVVLATSTVSDVWDWQRPGNSQDSDELPVSVQLVSDPGAPNENFHAPPVIRLQDEKCAVLPLFSGRSISEFVDMELVRSWISGCKELESQETAMTITTTTTTSPSNPQIPTFLRFVDVIKECIVNQINSPKFAALSSAWGDSHRDFQLLNDNENELRQQHQVAINNPKIWVTIRDAMSVCKSLDIRYLWVDCLCIIQDNDADKEQQWSAMHQVYENAILTIVAAAGSNADAGLPGISRRLREHQKVFRIQGLQLTLQPDALKRALDRSAWAKRAWTMQEGLISRRKLIFTQDQAYFACDHGNCAESFNSPIHLRKPVVKTFRDDPYKLDTVGLTNWEVYESVVSDYTKRSLFNEENIFYAFAAISEVLRRDMFGGRLFLACLPLCMLDVSLLWTRCENLACSCGVEGLRRRVGSPGTMSAFPSWSWTGWVGHVEYDDVVGNLPERIISQVTWLDGPRELPADATGEPSNDWPLWNGWKRLSKSKAEPFYVLKDGDWKRHFSYPMDLESQPSHNPMNPGSGALSFRAEVVYLKVSNERHSLGSKRISNTKPSSKDPLKVVDERGIQIGIVFEDGILPDNTSTTTSCFIKLSQTTVSTSLLQYDPAFDRETNRILRPTQISHRSERPIINISARIAMGDKIFDLDHYSGDTGWCLYNVIMVQWRDEVAYRIGMGKIHIQAFDQAQPETKSIVLG